MRIVAAIVLSTMPTVSISWLRKVWWVSLNSSNEASSITALTSSSNSAGRMLMLAGRGGAEARADLDEVAGDLVSRIGRLSAAAWPISPSRSSNLSLSSSRRSAP